MGNKKERKKLIAELEENPLILSGREMKLVDSEKYLGETLSVDLTESVAATVKRRVGIVSHIAFETRHIIDDARTVAIGGLSVAFSIFEMALIPMILYNAEMWGEEISKKNVKTLNKLQLRYIRIVTGMG